MAYTDNDTAEDSQEEYTGTTEDIGHVHGKWFWVLVSYFLLMACCMYPANKLHLEMIGVIAAMGAAAVILGLILLIMWAIRRKFRSFHLNKRQWLEMMAGYESETIEVEGYSVETTQPAQNEYYTPPQAKYSQALVPATSTTVQTVADDGLEDSIIERDSAHISDTLMPSVHRLIGQQILAIGMRRSGKSNLVAVLFEELARYGLPFMLFDTMDEYNGMVHPDYLGRGVLAGNAALLRANPNLQNFMALHTDNAYDFGRAIMDGCLQVVINLKSYDDETAAIIMCQLIAGVNDWQEERPNEKRVPVIAGLDEAQKWLPQDLAESCVTRTTQYELHKAWFDKVVARGGKNGWTVIAATQRYSQINKKFLQSLWKFLMYQSEETDLERYEKYKIPREFTLQLRQGEAVVFSPLCLGFVTMIRKRHSPHLGHTPGLDALLAHQKRVLPVSIVLARAASSATLPTETPYYQSQAETSQRETHHAPVTQEQPLQEQRAEHTRSLSSLLQLALDLFKQGHTTTAALAAAMNQSGKCRYVSASNAYQLLVQLDQAGYIQRQKKTRSGEEAVI